MVIKSIKHNVEWPRKTRRAMESIETKSEYTIAIYPMAGHRSHWGLLRDALARLEVGDVLNLQTEAPYAKSARLAVYYYAAQHNISFATQTTGQGLKVKRIPDQRKEL